MRELAPLASRTARGYLSQSRFVPANASSMTVSARSFAMPFLLVGSGHDIVNDERFLFLSHSLTGQRDAENQDH